MSDLIFSFEDGSEYLCHYGVTGMKWGVRKDRVLTTMRARKKHAAKYNATQHAVNAHLWDNPIDSEEEAAYGKAYMKKRANQERKLVRRYAKQYIRANRSGDVDIEYANAIKRGQRIANKLLSSPDPNEAIEDYVRKHS